MIRKWTQDLNKHVLKNILKWQKKAREKISTPLGPGNCKSKLLDITTCLSERFKIKEVITTSADTTMGKLDYSYITGRMYI